jgi:hypothetical protein
MIIVRGVVGVVLLCHMSRQGPMITPISATLPGPKMTLDTGYCMCNNGILVGSRCKLAGGSCDKLNQAINMSKLQSCECIGGILTGLTCPDIGQPCYGGLIKHPDSMSSTVYPNYTPNSDITNF